MNDEQETKPANENNDGGNKPAAEDVLKQQDALVERMEQANRDKAALLDREEKAERRKALGGTADAGQEIKEPEEEKVSNEDYAKKVMSGEESE